MENLDVPQRFKRGRSPPRILRKRSELAAKVGEVCSLTKPDRSRTYNLFKLKRLLKIRNIYLMTRDWN